MAQPAYIKIEGVTHSIGIEVVGKYDNKNKKIPKCHNKAIRKPRTTCFSFA